MSSDYKIEVGRIARTLLYEDSQGTICFTFDVVKDPQDSLSKKWTLGLDQPINEYKKIDSVEDEALRAVKKARIETALRRAEQFLLSKGYEVAN